MQDKCHAIFSEEERQGEGGQCVVIEPCVPSPLQKRTDAIGIIEPLLDTTKAAVAAVRWWLARRNSVRGAGSADLLPVSRRLA